MKISRADCDTLFPESLLHTGIPPKIFFWLQRVRLVKAKNFVLTTRWTESRRDARVQCRVRFVDLVTAGKTISPDIAEIIEVIVTSARDQNHVCDWCDRRLNKSRCLLRVIADKRRSEEHERALLPCVHPAVKETGREREPRSRSQIVLIINRCALKESARRPDESVLIRIVQLPLMIVAKNEFVFPPIANAKIDMWRDEPFLGQKIVERSRIENCILISRIAVCISEQRADAELLARRIADIRDSGRVAILIVRTRIVGVESTDADRIVERLGPGTGRIRSNGGAALGFQPSA